VRIAVVTLTRDRLEYTKHCFETLRVNAGCDYDHFVLDQGSGDGTAEWLIRQDDLEVVPLAENVGICRG
jgi:GT2 family glycosyltransferase